MKKILFCILIFLCILMLGCTTNTNEFHSNQTSQTSSGSSILIEPVVISNGWAKGEMFFCFESLQYFITSEVNLNNENPSMSHVTFSTWQRMTN